MDGLRNIRALFKSNKILEKLIFMKKKKNINKNKFQKIGILGFGEVGRAVAKFYRNPKIKDLRLKKDDKLEGIDVLHICIPWSSNFIKIVKKEIKKIKPKLIIIHSTIAPGTTKKIAQATKLPVVHSPIRGIHPHLYKGIKTFVKYIGADNKKAGKIAQKHLESWGIKTKIFYPSATTEIGKLLDTTYYGICIAWHGEMKKLCDKLGLDFNKAVTDFNQSYNKGYLKLRKKNVIRPVLYPPQKGIAGHCIIPNTKILQKYFKSKTIDLVLKYKPKKK